MAVLLELVDLQKRSQVYTITLGNPGKRIALPHHVRLELKPRKGLKRFKVPVKDLPPPTSGAK